MLINAEELFEPYTKDGCTIPVFIKWLLEEKIDSDIIDVVLKDIFLRLKNGESFLGKCDCGCTLENVHTKINHYALRKCKELQTRIYAVRGTIIGEKLNNAIIQHIHNQNEQYLAEECPDGKFPDIKEVEQRWKTDLLRRENEINKRERNVIIQEAKVRKALSVLIRREADELEKKKKKSIFSWRNK